MDGASFLVVLAMAILVAGYIAKPLILRQGILVSDQERRSSALEAERERILAAIQELDMDQAMGKLSSDDYARQRTALLAQGAAVLKELDAFAGASESPPPASTEPTLETSAEDLEDRIEAAVAELRERRAQANGFCTKCGEPLFAGDRFCTRCGARTPLQPEPQA